MKPIRTHAGGVRHEQRMTAPRDDSYRATEKLSDPATCPHCGATYAAGRWKWGAAPAGAASTTCPACQRIADKYPAGYVTIAGEFVAQHRDEVLNLVVRHAERVRAEHPLQRIIDMDDTAKGVLVTTTDGHLARGIAIALQGAFKGSLDLTFARHENMVRATWSRPG